MTTPAENGISILMAVLCLALAGLIATGAATAFGAFDPPKNRFAVCDTTDGHRFVIEGDKVVADFGDVVAYDRSGRVIERLNINLNDRCRFYISRVVVGDQP